MVVPEDTQPNVSYRITSIKYNGILISRAIIGQQHMYVDMNTALM